MHNSKSLLALHRFGITIAVAILLSACRGPGSQEAGAITVMQTPAVSLTEDEPASISWPTPTATSMSTGSSMPDSLRLSFIRSGKLWLWQEDVERLLADDNAADVNISHDGQLIAFTKLQEITLADGTTRLSAQELWSVNSDGTGERLLISADDLQRIKPGDHDIVIYRFDWIPGTHQLLFNTIPALSYQKPTDDLHLLNVQDGSWETLLPAGEGGNFLVAPNGQAAAVVSETQISLLNIRQSEVRTLLTYPLVIPPGCCWYYPAPVWAADSRSLSVVIPPPEPRGDATVDLWHLPLDGSPATIVAEIGLDFRFWPLEQMISPDLNWIAYPEVTSSGENQLEVAQIEGTQTYTVSGFPDGVISSLNWGPESEFLAVGTRKGLPPLNLVRVGDTVTTPVQDAILETVSWIDPAHFIYHTGNHNRPVLSVGSVAGGSQAIIEFDGDPEALTRFIDYDVAR